MIQLQEPVCFFRGNVPPTEIDEVSAKVIADAEILMVDGNDMKAAIEGAKVAKTNGTKVLYDAGGLYEGVPTYDETINFLKEHGVNV